MKDLDKLRKEYKFHSLDPTEVHPDPLEQLRLWMREALDSDVPEPNAMTLATATPDGIPSARIVLLKGIEQEGIVFYSNYDSQKGKELQLNPFGSVVFCWLELERQIRLDGPIEKIDPTESTQYFQSRPRGSQIGAWSSDQSQPIASRAQIEDRMEQVTASYKGQAILPRPEHWGGYILKPSRVEFWQGRPNRLHDRVNYRKAPEGGFLIERLQP